MKLFDSLPDPRLVPPPRPDTMFDFPPEHLSPQAMEIWEWYGRHCEHKEYFKPQHIRLFADLCELEAWLEKNHFRDEVAVVYNRLGDAKMNPALTAWTFVFNQVQKLRKELAIHPQFDMTLAGWQNGTLAHIPGDGTGFELPARIQYYLPENGRSYGDAVTED